MQAPSSQHRALNCQSHATKGGNGDIEHGTHQDRHRHEHHREQALAGSPKDGGYCDKDGEHTNSCSASTAVPTAAIEKIEKSRIFGVAKPLLCIALKETKVITREQYKEIGAAVVRKTLHLQHQLQEALSLRVASVPLSSTTVTVSDERIIELASRYITAAATTNTQQKWKKHETEVSVSRWITKHTTSSSTMLTEGSGSDGGCKEELVVHGRHVDFVVLRDGPGGGSSGKAQRSRLQLRAATRRPKGGDVGCETGTAKRGEELLRARAWLQCWFEKRDREAVFVTQLYDTNDIRRGRNGSWCEIQVIGARGFQLPGFVALAADVLTKLARSHEVDLELLQQLPSSTTTSLHEPPLCDIANADALPLRRPLFLLEMGGLTFVNTCRIPPHADLSKLARRMLRELAQLHLRKAVHDVKTSTRAIEKEDAEVEESVVSELRTKGRNGWPQSWTKSF